MHDVLLFLAVFAACVVESVEALTIVLAVGLTRGWRSTMRGVLAGLATLVVVVIALGPALTVIPIDALRLVVGGLLLVFGLGWLRKAILRASGFKGLHDEDAIYERELRAAQESTVTTKSLIGDSYAFALAYKGVVLEGLEVVFIVLTFGANQHSIPLAAVGAGAAVIVVTALGLAVRAPLARVPENTLKFGVGVLLTSFGIFWGVEGAGGSWPGSDAALPVVIVGVLVVAVGATAAMRRVRARHWPAAPSPATASDTQAVPR